MEFKYRTCGPTAFLTVTSLLAILTALSVSAVEPLGDVLSTQMCVDHKGEKVGHGERYFPMGTDRCTECTCINGKSEMCISVFCSPPENCRQPHELNDKCCEFVCLDGDLDRPISNHNNTVLKPNDSETINATNLGLRLVASTVTSFLILALLLFMIHRLRQRRLLLMIRRIQSRRMQAAGNHLSRRLSLEDDASVGYFVGHDQIDFAHYSDPPPPYMFWKPPEAYMPPGEAPPPYEASIGTPYNTFYALINGTLVDVTRNDGTINSTYPNIGTVLTSQGQLPVNEHNTLPPTPPKRVEDRGTQAPPPQPPVQQESEQTVQAHQLSHSESASSISMHSDNEVSNNVATETAAIASDVQYEDLPSYLPNNVTVLHVGENVTPAINLRDEDLVNGNVFPSTTIKELYTSIAQTHRAVPCSCANNRSSDQRTANTNCRHKCHSYGDFISYWQNHVANRRHGERRRHSLQPTANRQNNNFYPDPTSWAGEGSESSSSSSPTYEQPTLSPSSSDSSSMDVDFEPESFRATDKDGDVSRNPKRSETKSSKSKGSSLDKRLLQLKKFSLPHKKKKADKVTQVEENQIQTSDSANVSSIAVNQPRSTRAHSIAFCNELKGARASLKPVFTVEAINEMFNGHQPPKQSNKGSSEQGKLNRLKNDAWISQIPHVTLRPTSLPLPSEKIDENNVHSDSSGATNACQCVHPCSCNSGPCIPVSPAVVGMHSSATATISQLDRGPPVSPPSCSDLSTDGVEAYITQQHAIHLPAVQNNLHAISSVKPKVSVSCMSCHNAGSNRCSHIVQSTSSRTLQRTKSDFREDNQISSDSNVARIRDEALSSNADAECRKESRATDASVREDVVNIGDSQKIPKKNARTKVGSKYIAASSLKQESSTDSQNSGHHSDSDGTSGRNAFSNQRTEPSRTMQKGKLKSSSLSKDLGDKGRYQDNRKSYNHL